MLTPFHSCDIEVVGSIAHSALSNFLSIAFATSTGFPFHSDFLQPHFPFPIAYLFGNGGDEPPSCPIPPFDPSIPRMFHPSMLPFILIRSPFAHPFFSQWCRLPPTLPFTFCFISLPSALPVVMTPSSRMMLEWSNCPRMPASLRKERRCLSEQPARNVFMATGSSLLLGSFRQPRHTSPKSPVGGDGQTGHDPY